LLPLKIHCSSTRGLIEAFLVVPLIALVLHLNLFLTAPGIRRGSGYWATASRAGASLPKRNRIAMRRRVAA